MIQFIELNDSIYRINYKNIDCLLNFNENYEKSFKNLRENLI